MEKELQDFYKDIEEHQAKNFKLMIEDMPMSKYDYKGELLSFKLKKKIRKVFEIKTKKQVKNQLF